MKSDAQVLFNFTKKNVVIIGGAGHLGSAFTLGLVEAGATVLAVGLNLQSLKKFAENAIGFPGVLRIVPCDFHDYNEIEKAATAFEFEFGKALAKRSGLDGSLIKPIKFRNSDSSPNDFDTSLNSDKLKTTLRFSQSLEIDLDIESEKMGAVRE